MTPVHILTSPPPPNLPTASDARLRDVAMELEAVFLTEMLTSAGLGKASQTLSGGIGEDQFGSLVVREQARLLAQSGGIGLAESLYHALKEAADDK
jgi:Rod binding domain-containing protein